MYGCFYIHWENVFSTIFTTLFSYKFCKILIEKMVPPIVAGAGAGAALPKPPKPPVLVPPAADPN